MCDAKKHVAQQENFETAWNIEDKMDPNITKPLKIQIPNNECPAFRVVSVEDLKLRYEGLSYLGREGPTIITCKRLPTITFPPLEAKMDQNITKPLKIQIPNNECPAFRVVGVEDLKLRYEDLSYLGREGPTITCKRLPTITFPPLKPREEPRQKFVLKDQFHKEVQRGIYNKNPNDPPQDSLAYYKAAENYALFGLTAENPDTGFEVFKTTGADCNQTYYPHNLSLSWQHHSKPSVGQVLGPSLLQIKIINSSKLNMTYNKRVQLKALKNFCKEAVVVNSVLSSAYKQHMNLLSSLNYQPHLQQLSRVAAIDPKVFTYGHKLAECFNLANRASVMAQILQKKPISSRSIVRDPAQITGQVNYQQHIEILKISHCRKMCLPE